MQHSKPTVVSLKEKCWLHKLMFSWSFYTARQAILQRDQWLRRRCDVTKGQCIAAYNMWSHQQLSTYSILNDTLRQEDFVNFARNETIFLYIYGGGNTSKCVCNMTPCLLHNLTAIFMKEGFSHAPSTESRTGATVSCCSPTTRASQTTSHWAKGGVTLVISGFE